MGPGILASGSSSIRSGIFNQNQNMEYNQRNLHQDPYWTFYIMFISLAVLEAGILASGSGDTSIKIWNTTSGTCIKTLTGHSSYVYSLAVLEEGILASGSWDNSIKIWNTTSGTCIKTLTGHSDGVYVSSSIRRGHFG